MIKLKISKLLAKDLLEGKGKHIKDGYLSFNAIRFAFKKDKAVVSFLDKNKMLATSVPSLVSEMAMTKIFDGVEFTFELIEGKGRIELEGQ